ncbi:hypothetical protein H257_00112 [Aphanomyces astaci]|uniref:Uncharacterized protein n=1 Tax=Aphanomyces astaci TaxID=112090 RepID=W4H937_APHAT|nr:hypothetical protein H257_00112 [Aphanomyces astaci]ETV88545.1 hypothetical protein H257_00112 [Aphanomyces astaci]|eukprot:XP_009820945.1 hypothetical protein H257_00112 [Aphanomyces astaci]
MAWTKAVVMVMAAMFLAATTVVAAGFTYGEECLLRQKQGDSIESLARQLQGHSPFEIKRKCIELGLQCGAAARRELNSRRDL